MRGTIKRLISALIILTMTLQLAGCAPSEDEIYDVLDSVSRIHNATLELTMDVNRYGNSVEASGIFVVDSDMYHSVITALGKKIQEEYCDGEYVYTIENGTCEKKAYEGQEQGSELTSWEIDSISTSGGVTTVKGTMELDWGVLDDSIKDLKMDFKMKMDKDDEIKSIILKTESVSPEVSNLRIKIYNINGSYVDLSGLDQYR